MKSFNPHSSSFSYFSHLIFLGATSTLPSLLHPREKLVGGVQRVQQSLVKKACVCTFSHIICFISCRTKSIDSLILWK
ncbi:hypothetical protein ACJIZ3_011451 [Penstemon smallii]|uniref:Uncharacterized protein n=1 Tax=Penstemon smallii TaxID=265156 RepID=A0ABD3UJ51_9LAMI